MAEVAASIIGISTFGVKLTLTLYEFSATASSARDQVDHIAKHVTLYANVLELLGERFEADAPIITEAAFDLVDELYDQSKELFDKIRSLLPRREGRDDLSFLQKIGWNFKKTKVDLLVGELEYLKSTVQLLVTVIFTGKKIRSYRKRKDKAGTKAPVSGRDAVYTQCIKAQNAIVEQVNTAQRLPDLQKQHDESEPVAIEGGRSSTGHHSSAMVLLTEQTGVIARFNDSLAMITTTSDRRAYVLQNSTQLLQDLLQQWTIIEPSDDEVRVSYTDRSNTRSRNEPDVYHRAAAATDPSRPAPGPPPKSTNPLRSNDKSKPASNADALSDLDDSSRGSSLWSQTPAYSPSLPPSSPPSPRDSAAADGKTEGNPAFPAMEKKNTQSTRKEGPTRGPDVQQQSVSGSAHEFSRNQPSARTSQSSQHERRSPLRYTKESQHPITEYPVPPPIHLPFPPLDPYPLPDGSNPLSSSRRQAPNPTGTSRYAPQSGQFRPRSPSSWPAPHDPQGRPSSTHQFPAYISEDVPERTERSRSRDFKHNSSDNDGSDRGKGRTRWKDYVKPERQRGTPYFIDDGKFVVLPSKDGDGFKVLPTRAVDRHAARPRRMAMDVTHDQKYENDLELPRQ